MDQIGSSTIALPDAIICSVAIGLFYRLTTLTPNSLICRVVATLSGCMIVAIMVVIPAANNLTQYGVLELAMVGVLLAIGLLKWNDARTESRSAAATTPSTFLQ
jgi:peptidoglycan/LPS O-acetylase OafA/YrhL